MSLARTLAIAASGLALAVAAWRPASAAPVLMISIDGLRPADVLQAESRGIHVPNLRRLAREGAYATAVHNALPTVTYPNHTTLVTGVWPAVHGVGGNTVFDPLGKDEDGWFWYATDIKVATLWDVAHRDGLRVASLGWPATVGSKSIDLNIPEDWRAHDSRDALLNRSLATPGLPEALEASGAPLVDTADTGPDADALKARDVEAIYTLKRPDLFTVHLSSLDHVEHQSGPDSAEAHAALARIDAEVGEIVQVARSVEPDLVVAIVSDHGFAPVQHEIDLIPAFVAAGLMRLDDTGKPVAWEAAPWSSGGSAAVVLARPGDPALRARVADLLHRLAADPASGIGRVIDRAQIAAMGGTPQADFFVDARIGYDFGDRTTGPLIQTARVKGTHGYFPDHPEMNATLILDGPHLPLHGDLGAVDMRTIAPTLARLLKTKLPGAALPPLF